MFDLGIEGGQVVTPKGSSRSHVYVQDGRIAAVTPARAPVAETVDASGLMVMPGMVDAHVHFMDPADSSRETFPDGTAAAARAGVTTVIEHTHARPVLTADDLAEKRRYLRDRSRVDFALAAHAWPDRLEDVPGVWEAGAAFIKAFTCTTHGVPAHAASDLENLFGTVAQCGAVCLVHCEDDGITAEAERRLRADGRTDGGILPAWRSKDAELTAVETVRGLAERAGASVIVAHASSVDTLAAAGNLVVESCPQYLHLFEREVTEHGAFRKFTPPARARSAEDLEAMWQALADGRIDFISSDHAPSTAEQKRSGSIWDVHFGLPGIDTTLSVLLDGAARGRLSYERVVAAYAETPARLYGLWPAKGSLRPGAHADIILVDPREQWKVKDGEILSRAGWSPFVGRTLIGRPVRTYLRGRLAFDDGRVIAEPGVGRAVQRPAHPAGKGTETT